MRYQSPLDPYNLENPQRKSQKLKQQNILSGTELVFCSYDKFYPSRELIHSLH